MIVAANNHRTCRKVQGADGLAVRVWVGRSVAAVVRGAKGAENTTGNKL